MTPRNAANIARFTVRKAMREKVYLLILLVTLVFIACAGSVSFHQTGVQLKFLKDVALAVVSGFGFLLALFIASDLLPHELETRAIQFLISRPVTMLDVVAGKFFAFSALLALNLAPLVVEVVGMVWLYGGGLDWNLVKGSILIGIELIAFGAIVLFISSWASRLITLFAGILVYVAAHLSEWIVGTFLATSPAWLRESSRVLLALLPDLSHFDSRYVVVHQYDVPLAYVGLLLLHAALYSALYLLATRWVLEGKEV